MKGLMILNYLSEIWGSYPLTVLFIIFILLSIIIIYFVS